MNLQIADQRILRGVPATLSFQYVDETGAAADPGVVTIGITKADGSVLIAPATATTGTSTAPRTYTLAAANNLTLELLTVAWQLPAAGPSFTTLVEVAGGFFFTIAEARASDATLADATKYPAAAIIQARLEVEAECEEICNVAFVPRYRRIVLDGSGNEDLILLDNQLRSVRSVRTYSSATSSVAFTASELADLSLDDDLVIRRPFGSTFDDSRRSNVAVEYEHGYNHPPADLKRASLTRLRYRLNMPTTGIPDRATSFTPAGNSGTYRLDTPDAFKTGMPEVDAVYGRYSRRTQGNDAGPRPSSRPLDLDPQRNSLFHGPRR